MGTWEWHELEDINTNEQPNAQIINGVIFLCVHIFPLPRIRDGVFVGDNLLSTFDECHYSLLLSRHTQRRSDSSNNGLE